MAKRHETHERGKRSHVKRGPSEFEQPETKVPELEEGGQQAIGLVPTQAERRVRLFKNGRSQAVRLPREFRFDGDRVRVRRAGRGVLVEPVVTDVAAWFAELDRLASEPFMPEGRQQPPTPERDVFE
jgi:antitoxin VapB